MENESFSYGVPLFFPLENLKVKSFRRRGAARNSE
jgi:hypothetical protein